MKNGGCLMPIAHERSSSANFPKENGTIRDLRIPVMQPMFAFENMVLTEEQKILIGQALSLIKNEDLIYNKWGLKSVLKKGNGFKVSLYGPPGTGKTMAAHAVAKALEKQIIEVNYAEIESKYVGETAKNIEMLFSVAKNEDAVLFFDEADALLSKRVTEMHSSADVSVNQTRSVLLKLLDRHSGVCVFATNFINNFDYAFMRRITHHIYFPLPDEKQRCSIWEYYLVESLPHSANPAELAAKFPGISGSDIANAVLAAAASAAYRNALKIEQDDFENAITKIINANCARDGKAEETEDFGHKKGIEQ